MLYDKGFTKVGQPDGLMGGRTVTAIRAFRAENGFPAGDGIDDKFMAALSSAGPRQVSKARVETEARDLREKGNTQVAALDGFGSLGKAIGLGGVIGGINESGVLERSHHGCLCCHARARRDLSIRRWRRLPRPAHGLRRAL
jgi:peptidoglycan hydrolase-like protein with peptidoglycan-binding domain